MNPRQRYYDSYDKTNKLLKLTNSFYHFRNLESIRNRKSQYNNCPTFYHPRKPVDPIKSFSIKKQNEIVQEKLNKIKRRTIKPKMNDVFLIKESKIQEFGQRHKNIHMKLRQIENENYIKRIKNQKAFINPKAMDKDYKEEHLKTLMKIKKIGENDNIVLPPIKNSHDNPTLMESKKYYFTESGLKSGRDYESKIKSDDEEEYGSDSFYDTGKGSGTNSEDK